MWNDDCMKRSKIIIVAIICAVVGFLFGTVYNSNEGILVQDTISRWDFTVVCKRGTDKCFCSYHRDPNSKYPTYGDCPWDQIKNLK